MKKFIPHLLLLSFLVGLLVVGVVLHSPASGAFFGAFIALLQDPLLVGGAVIIGGLVIRQRYLLPTVMLFAVAFSLYIAHINAWTGARLTVFGIFTRIMVVLSIAYIVNAIRLVVGMTTRQPSSSEKS